MWTTDTWAAFVEAVEPYGWTEHQLGTTPTPFGGESSIWFGGGLLIHTDGAIARVDQHPTGKLVTDYATPSNGTSRILIGGWKQTAKRWAEGPGAARVAAHGERLRAEARSEVVCSAVNARAASLIHHMTGIGQSAGLLRKALPNAGEYAVVDLGDSLYVTLHEGTGIHSMSGELRAFAMGPRDLAALLTALAEWTESEEAATT